MTLKNRISEAHLVRVPIKPFGEWLRKEATKARKKTPGKHIGVATQINKAIRLAYEAAHPNAS